MKHIPLLLIIHLQPLLFIAAAASSNTVLPGCQSECGGVEIPYPFGIGRGCFYDDDFEVRCNNSKPYFQMSKNESHEIINIALSGQLSIRHPISSICYNRTNLTSEDDRKLNLTDMPAFRLSYTRNNFTTVGCNTLAIAFYSDYLASSCVSLCTNRSDVMPDGAECYGEGCCQAIVPTNAIFYSVDLNIEMENTGTISDFNPCSYAFLADREWYKFDVSHLTRAFDSTKVPVVLDWAIRNSSDNCTEAARNLSSNACKSNHSYCTNSSNGPGYLCKCQAGHKGNPYLENGCQDIDECEDPERYQCFGECMNTPGNFTCSCPSGTDGDSGRKDGCREVASNFTKSLRVLTGIGISIVLLGATGLWIFLAIQKRKVLVAKQRFFEQNGGVLLQQQMNSHGSAMFKLFTLHELEKATNKFDADQIIGRGGHGTVYRGVLDDNRTVAIKKSKVMGENQMKEFAKEMLILSQINHRNIVKLLGCCLEVEVPMLVYEFIPNGTLYHYIHAKNHMANIPLDARLRIAAESAEALAYLHSCASPPIIHGDIKPSNILLDEHFAAKVSDFGASKLAPNNGAQLATLIQGTCGYLDPEYLQKCMLTDKSDVYSFGIVLVELLTRKKALYFEGSEEERHLPLLFISALKQNRLLDILDSEIICEGEKETLEEVSMLAAECLNVKGEERPTMKVVSDVLARSRKQKPYPWAPHKAEDTERPPLDEWTSANDSSTCESTQKKAVLNIQVGR